MQRLLLFYALALFLVQCSGARESEVYQFDRLTVSKHPTNPPPSIPRSFFPEDAKFLTSSELKSSFSNVREAYLQLESNQTTEVLKKLILSRADMGDWKLVDTTETETEISFLLEGFVKKSMTIILSKKTDQNQIQFLFKKQSNY